MNIQIIPCVGRADIHDGLVGVSVWLVNVDTGVEIGPSVVMPQGVPGYDGVGTDLYNVANFNDVPMGHVYVIQVQDDAHGIPKMLPSNDSFFYGFDPSSPGALVEVQRYNKIDLTANWGSISDTWFFVEYLNDFVIRGDQVISGMGVYIDDVNWNQPLAGEYKVDVVGADSGLVISSAREMTGYFIDLANYTQPGYFIVPTPKTGVVKIRVTRSSDNKVVFLSKRAGAPGIGSSFADAARFIFNPAHTIGYTCRVNYENSIAGDTVTLTYPTIEGADGYLVYREAL